MAVDITQIGSVYDNLETKIKTTLDEQWNNGRLTGSDYAQVLSNTLTTAMQLAVQSVQRQPINDAQEQLLGSQKLQVDKQTDISNENLSVMLDTHQSKVDLAKNQTDKVLADKELILAQRDGITQQVIDNRKIKALNSLANTYGVFGSGGLTMSSDMWKVYFSLISELITELVDYKGEWDASTNTPDISAITDMKQGDFYRVSVAGSTNLDGTTSWDVGDIVVYNKEIWKKSSVLIPSDTSVSVAT